MDADTIKIVLIGLIIIFGIRMFLDIILEIKKIELETIKLKSKSPKLLVNPTIKDLSYQPSLNVGKILRLVKERERNVYGSESDTPLIKRIEKISKEDTLQRAYLKENGDLDIVGSNYFNFNVADDFIPPLDTQIKQQKELFQQDRLIKENFFGRIFDESPKYKNEAIGTQCKTLDVCLTNDCNCKAIDSSITTETKCKALDIHNHFNDRIKKYFKMDKNAKQFGDPDVRAPPNGNEKRLLPRNVEPVNKNFSIDNWIYSLPVMP